MPEGGRVDEGDGGVYIFTRGVVSTLKPPDSVARNAPNFALYERRNDRFSRSVGTEWKHTIRLTHYQSKLPSCAILNSNPLYDMLGSIQ